MKPVEREMFQEAYADALARKMESTSDRRDITAAMFNSPQERAKIAAVFGPEGVNRLEAFTHRETVFDAARKALGNSTTARQLIEAGLAGGTIGGVLSGGDLRSIGEGALAGGLGHGVLSRFAPELAATGMRTAVGYVDRKTATRVAQLLASNDPRELMQGLQIASRNQRVMQSLRNMGAQAAAMIGSVRRPQVPISQLPSMQGRQRDQTPALAQAEPRARGGRIAHSESRPGKYRPDVRGADDSKISQAAAHYGDRRGKPNHKCAICAHMIWPDKCTLVAGNIKPGGGCDLFERKRKVA
jgi:hypothetical protein